MRDYEAIESHIREAHVQRSIYIAHFLKDAIFSLSNGIRHTAQVLLCAARAKTRNNAFTFDA